MQANVGSFNQLLKDVRKWQEFYDHPMLAANAGTRNQPMDAPPQFFVLK